MGQSNFTGKGYDADPTAGGEETAKVLANGRVAADVRFNSDADHYEILVAGGTEGWNYNVTYAPMPTAPAAAMTTISTRRLSNSPLAAWMAPWA